MSATPRTDKVYSTEWKDGTPETLAALMIDHAEKLEIELAEMTAYADKLAAGLPDGTLPKDIENLREANLQLAMRVHDLEESQRYWRDAAYKNLHRLFSLLPN